ncbi:MAG: hypothetical protein ACKOCC_08965 [Actinomycetota bacterium]
MSDERDDDRDDDGRDRGGTPEDRPAPRRNPLEGFGNILALAGVGYLLLLVLMNTDRIDVNVVFYTFQDTPVWWFTVLVVALTLLVDRLVRFVLRRARRRRDD